MLDDAAYLIVNSSVQDSFVYKTSFNIQMLLPVKIRKIRATDELKFKFKKKIYHDAILYDKKIVN